ncbi:kinesin-like protein KIN12B-like, partial [Trifolium medium]|nr:kinesin-like protein KIN12B-like [Trifolium medium]
LENICKEQAARIDELNQLVEKLKGEKELNSIIVYQESKQTEHAEDDNNSMKDEYKVHSCL